MSYPFPQRTKPATAATIAGLQARHSTTPFYPYRKHNARLPRDWRARVTAQAGSYYAARIDKLGRVNATGWAQGRCPFHDDKQGSFSINPGTGRWKCFSGCGAGDLTAFHMRVTGLGFKRAARDLLGLTS